MKPKWSEPTLFEPESVAWPELRLRLDYWLSGPQDLITAHWTLYDHLGTMVAYRGGETARLVTGAHDLVAAHSIKNLEETLRKLSPF